MGYADGLLTDEAANQELERAREISDRWRIYLGEHDKPLKVTAPEGGPVIDDNITPNFCGRFVDQGVSFLFGGDVVFTLDPGETAQEEGDIKVSPDETYLDDVWRANRRKTLLPKFGLNGGVAGHAYFKILPRGKQLPRLLNLDPCCVSVQWDEEDIETVVAYKVQWNVSRAGKDMVRRQLVEFQDDGSWLITDEIGEEQISRTMYGAELSTWVWKEVASPVEWRYPFPPIVDCQNLPLPNEYYGTPDLSRDVTDLNTATSRVLSNLSRVIRFHGHPKTIFKGVQEGDIRVDADGAIYLPDGEGQDASNLEMSSDLSASLSVYREVYDALHEVGRRPKIAAGKLDNIGQLSGLAIKILYGPLVEVTRTKQGPYGDCLVELNKRLLVLAGKAEYDSAPETTLHWPELLPTDELAEVNAALGLDQLGVSKATLIERQGFDSRTEAARKASEAQATLDNIQTSFNAGGHMGINQPGGGPVNG